MSEKNNDPIKNPSSLIADTEKERLLRDIFRPDIEKLRLLTLMLRNNAILKKAKITHK